MNNKLKSYSLALFEISKEENKLKEFVDFLIKTKDQFIDGDVSTFFMNKMIKILDKNIILKEVIQEEIILNWFMIIIENDKYKWIGDIINKFIELGTNELNIKVGTIWTTENIDTTTVQKLKDKLSKNLNSELYLESKIDKELIAGIKVTVEDQTWDNSIKNRIQELTKELLKERNV